MTDGEKKLVPLTDPLSRALDAMTRHGLDGDTMLLYISSVNLMQILELAGRRLAGGAGMSLPSVQLSCGTPPAPVEAALGSLAKLLGGGGINPAAIASLLAALCQNTDLKGLTGLLSQSAGQALKHPSSQVAGAVEGSESTGKTEKSAQDNPGENKPRREPPKIMKWEQLDDKKRGGAG